MRNWVIWMIRHRMAWLVKVIVVLSYPLILLAYWDEALDDVEHTLNSINNEARRQAATAKGERG